MPDPVQRPGQETREKVARAIEEAATASEALATWQELADAALAAAAPSAPAEEMPDPGWETRAEKIRPYDKLHYRQVRGRWMCRDAFGEWWRMPTNWRPGLSIEGFCWR